jgi:hypothetical protein
MSFLLAEDEALKDLIRGIKVSDEKNQDREVGVWFANPDVENRLQAYPYVTIELIDVSWANYRQHSGVWIDNDNQGTIEPEPGISYAYEMPVPWDLTYQMTSYARHPRHDRAIISHLLTNDFNANRSFLPVRNDIDTETGWRHITLQDFAKRDTVEDGRRLFRNVFTINVTSESQSGSGNALPEALAVRLNQDPTYIPPELQLP